MTSISSDARPARIPALPVGHRAFWMKALAGGLTVAALVLPMHQPAAATGQAGRSIWDGVYTDEQAARGSTAYAEACGECHGQGLEGGEMEPPLSGGEFLYAWDGLSVGDLFDRIRISMPPSNPNGVSRQEKADIIAHLLAEKRCARRGYRATHPDGHPARHRLRRRRTVIRRGLRPRAPRCLLPSGALPRTPVSPSPGPIARLRAARGVLCTPSSVPRRSPSAFSAPKPLQNTTRKPL